MTRFLAKAWVVLLLGWGVAPRLLAQASAEDTTYPGTLLPPGLLELDRAKTLLIGAFPFAYLLSTWGYDLVFWFQSGLDSQYTPWPAGPGTGSFTGTQLQEKYKTLILSSVALSAALALFDFLLGVLEPPPPRAPDEVGDG